MKTLIQGGYVVGFNGKEPETLRVGMKSLRRPLK